MLSIDLCFGIVPTLKRIDNIALSRKPKSVEVSGCLRISSTSGPVNARLLTLR